MECRMISQFLIAAPSSGSGKTTVSRGLMALLIKKGLKVQPFKCGPDYIDTKYHTAVCRRPSINLDTFMASAGHVKELYARYATGADACITEGMMGMYDGYDRDRGSSAEVAGLLNLPVILVVDAKSAAYSVAPLLSGFIHFRPEIRIAGVIFNRVGSPRHYEMLQEVCTELGIACLGYLPKQESLVQESRYLGLDFSHSKGTDALEELTGLMEKYIDYNRLLEETKLPAPIPPVSNLSLQEDLKISVACNSESFSFIYQEHLDVLLGKNNTGREYVVQQNLNNTLAIVKGEWKYIEPSDGPAIEFWTKMELGNDKQPQLYDLSSDPSEKTNVAKSHPEIVKELSALLESVKEE